MKRLRLPLIILLMLSLQMPQAEARLQKCPWYSTCSGPFVKLATQTTAAYCGQGGRSCCDCDTIHDNLQTEMDKHRREFILGTYWTGTVYPGLQTFLSKISSTMIKQTASRGAFNTAQDNLNSRTALQEGAAAAARNYLPSEALCRFASLSESLGADDIKRSGGQIQIATIGLKRNLGAQGSAAEAGSSGDDNSRRQMFVLEYCNANQGLTEMCGAGSKRIFSSIPKDQRYNRDISFARTIDSDSTIDADPLLAVAPRAPEQDIAALAANLYGNRQLANRYTRRQLNDSKSHQGFMENRSVTATRSVAENTYAAITSMKTKGSGSSMEYMKALLQELGLNEDLAKSRLGARPSYYAQMEFLTKKLYQDPVFYINLMEGKTNVARQSGAMEGIEVMQDRDMYQSMRRSEMLMAMLVQLQAQQMLNKTARTVKTENQEKN